MSNTIIRYCLLLFFISSCLLASAQETMLSSTSEAYLQKLIDTAKKYYPRMKAYQTSINMAKNDVQKEKKGWFDVVSFSYLYSPNNTTTLVNPSLLNGSQVGVFVNVGTLLQKPYNIKHAQGQVELAKAQLAEYNITIESLVKQRYYSFVQAYTVMKLRSQAVLDFENTLQEVKYKFEKGEETLQNFNQNVATYNDRLQTKIEAESVWLTAKASLEEMLGVKLEHIQ